MNSLATAPPRPALPVYELPFADAGLSYVALVYEIDAVLGVRDVAVFETRDGGFRYVGCGVFGRRFVKVGALANSFVRVVDRVLRAGIVGAGA